jgi:curved DNA-binding protein CbpA
LNLQTPAPIATGAKRRSTRIDHVVPLVISWVGPKAQPLAEKTSTASINCHGCRYFSRYALRKNSAIVIQIIENTVGTEIVVRQVAARVTWSRRSRRMAGLYQIGVEFETPCNLWNVAGPPEDWEFYSPVAKEHPATLLTEVDQLLRVAGGGNHYQLLDLPPNPERSDVKHRYYELARRFHPDRHMDHPEWAPRLQALMDALATAYKILSNDDLKARYDAEMPQNAGQDRREARQLAQQSLEKARECLAEKNYVGSILWLRRAIEIEPQCSSYRMMLGLSLAQVPEYRREAVEQFERAIEIDPSNLAAHLHYAQMLEQLNMPWRARPHYVRVLELDMNHREARARLNFLDTTAPRQTSRTSLLNRLAGRLSR